MLGRSVQDDEDAALFARIQSAERTALLPAKHATLSETMANSTDARMQRLAPQAAQSGQHDESDVPFLLSLLASGDAAVLEAGADALWKLAISGRVRAAMHQADGSRPLVSLLAHAEPKVVRAAAGALSILALDGTHRTTIVAAGGATALGAVCADGGDREAEQAARAVANVAADEGARGSLVDHSVAQHLAGMLRRRRAPTALREAACRALAALAADDDGPGPLAASAFVEAAGVPRLNRHSCRPAWLCAAAAASARRPLASCRSERDGAEMGPRREEVRFRCLFFPYCLLP